MIINPPPPTITSIITSGTVNGISATKSNPIITGTHNSDISTFNSKIEIWADNESGNNDYMLVKADPRAPRYVKCSLLGYTGLLDSTGNWSCQISANAVGNYSDLQARALYTKWVVPPASRKRAGPFLPALPVFSAPIAIDYRFTYFGEMLEPPTISCVVNQISYRNGVRAPAAELAKQQLEILWTMTDANTLICELTNPNETIIIVNSEKGFPPSVGGYLSRPKGQRKIIIKPNKDSIGIPYKIWKPVVKGWPPIQLPPIQIQKYKTLYEVTRSVILRATGTGGTIEKTLSYQSIINKDIPW